MEKEEIKTGEPVHVAGVILVPVVKTSLYCRQDKRHLSILCTRQSVSLIVVFPQATMALRVNGDEVSLEQLAMEVPGVKEIAKSIDNG